MIKYLLAATAVITLILNLLLTFYVVRSRWSAYSPEADSHEVIDFVLAPDDQEENAEDTRLLDTEII
jgi:hypothetical protein